MDSPYSPLAAPSRSPTLGHSQPAHADSHSPPLVPIPPPADASYDPNYHRQSSSSSRSGEPYYRDSYAPHHAHYAHPHAHAHAHAQGHRYPDDWHHEHPRPYSDWAPPHHHDPYYRPIPPRDPYGYRPHAARDPYGAYPPPPPPAPRDPYQAYPPYHDPYYDHSRTWHHPSAHPPSHYPAPAPATVQAVISDPPTVPSPAPAPPLASTAVSLGPHPVHGHLDPHSDLSIPILYLARPISTKTFSPLRQKFPHLELRFVNSLLELDRDLHRVRLGDLDKSSSLNNPRRPHEDERDDDDVKVVEDDEAVVPPKRTQRRVWITAVGGTDALVQRIWNATPDKIEWKEIVDLNHLDRELAWEDRRVVELLQGGEERGTAGGVDDDKDDDNGGKDEMADETTTTTTMAQTAIALGRGRPGDREWDEHERGRKEIEQREAEGRSQHRGEGQVDELDRVLRAVRGEKDRSQSREYVPLESSARTARGGGRAPERAAEPERLGPSRDGERGQAVVDRFEDMVTREYAPAYANDFHAGSGATDDGPRRGEDGSHSRKRTRHESDEEHDHSASRAARKKLEAICKAPRRNCVEWAKANGVAINEETRLVDDEPILGERHRGVWSLFGHELDDISPQIQVLMARAMRDVTYPPRLRLYPTLEAFEQLEETVPWFTTLLRTIGDRYELTGAASVAPQDPPISDDPLPAPTRLAETDATD